MENILLDALKSLSPANVLLVGVIVFLWKELQKERDARITANNASLELGHLVRSSLDRFSDLLERQLARKE